MCNIIIDRSNFREVRTQHHISQLDLALKAGVSKSTISTYETKNTSKYSREHVDTKPETEKALISTLKSMIDNGYRSTFIKSGRPTNKELEENYGGRCIRRNERTIFLVEGENISDYFKCINNIKKYCLYNGISLKDFANMIGVSKRIFEYNFNKYRVCFSERLKDLITKATGWTYEDILTGRINKGGEVMNWIPAKKVSDEELSDVKAEAIIKYSPTTQELIDDKIDREECYRQAKADIHEEEEWRPKTITVGEVFDSLPEKDKVYSEIGKAISESVPVSKTDLLKPSFDDAMKYGARQMDKDLYSGAQPVVPEGYSVMNKKYTYYAETGEYVLTYDLVKRFSRRISKEEFIASIKEDGK